MYHKGKQHKTSVFQNAYLVFDYLPFLNYKATSKVAAKPSDHDYLSADENAFKIHDWHETLTGTINSICHFYERLIRADVERWNCYHGNYSYDVFPHHSSLGTWMWHLLVSTHSIKRAKEFYSTCICKYFFTITIHLTYFWTHSQRSYVWKKHAQQADIVHTQLR